MSGSAPVAQLDRALPSEGKGCAFESRRVRHKYEARIRRVRHFKKEREMKRFLFLPILLLAACNSVYVKPNSLDKSAVVYTQRGGYTMKRSIKEALEERGYTVVVGNLKSGTYMDGEEFETDIEYEPAGESGH